MIRRITILLSTFLLVAALCYGLSGGGGGGGGAASLIAGIGAYISNGIINIFAGPGTTSPQANGALCNGQQSKTAAMASGGVEVTTSDTPGQFTAAAVGEPECISGTSATTVVTQTTLSAVNIHTCGTIATYIDPNHVTVSQSNASGGAVTGQLMRWGHDDSTAVAAMWTAFDAAGGGTITLPPGPCVITAGQTVPGDVPVNIMGAGSIRAYTPYETFHGLAPGAGFWVLTDALTVPALSMVPTSFGAQMDVWSGFSVWGCTGMDLSCGASTAATGVAVGNTYRQTLDHLQIGGFKGQGVSVTCPTTGYLSGFTFRSVLSAANGQNGIYLNCALFQQLNVIDSETANNGLNGFDFATGALYGVVFSNNVFQRDDTSATASTYEVNLQGGSVLYGPCQFDGGNYYEKDGGSSLTGFLNDGGQCTVSGVTGLTSDNGVALFASPLLGFHKAFSGTSIPSAVPSPATGPSGNAHTFACASDSATCVNGTTYAPGGSTACLIYSNGTNWIETGIGC